MKRTSAAEFKRQERNRIKREGMEAFLAGQPKRSCPYLGRDYWLWICGWESAELDSRHGRTFAAYKIPGMCDEFCKVT